MPKTQFQKNKDNAQAILDELKTKIHYNTFNAYAKKIEGSKRNTTLSKIMEELNQFTEIKPTAAKLTKKNLNKFVGEYVVDKFKNFQTKVYEYENVPSLKTLYNNITKKFDNHTSLKLFVKNNQNPDKIKQIGVSLDLLPSGFKAFERRINEIMGKINSVPGSDSIESGDFIDMSAFALGKFGDTEGLNIFGKSNRMLFKTLGIEESKTVTKDSLGRKKTIKNQDCAYQCLLRAGFNVEDKTLVNTVEKLKMYVAFNELPISIMCNSLKINRRIGDIFDGKTKKEIDIQGKKVQYVQLMNNEIKLYYEHFVKNSQYTIVFDELDEHADLIEGKPLLDDIYITFTQKIVKNGKVVFTAGELEKNNTTKEDNTVTKYLIFDYETVEDYSKSSAMQPYNLSILELSDSELVELEQADRNNDVMRAAQIRKKRCTTFAGFDCSYQFINWILKNQAGKRFIFIGYNNCNFDNFILLRDLLTYQENGGFVNVSQIFYNGNQILNFVVNGRHETFDLHKHLAVGSLKKNCESFKINCCSKKSFDHNLAQELYIKGELLQFIENNEELKEYNEYDVLATAVLFQKYRMALETSEATKPYAAELHKTKTIGSLIYKIFKESIKEKNIALPKLSNQYYFDMQRSKIAGRVESFNGVLKIIEKIVSTDVCSLYPFVMSVLNVWYPCGKIVEVGEGQYIPSDDKLGFWYCDIDQSNLKSKNLPNIYAFKTGIENVWDYEGVLQNYFLSNVMIDLLLKYECKVTIRNGIYFTEKRKSCDMFDFILQFMQEKNKQDKLVDTSEYNPALRETLKLLMNSLSGKVIEGLHTEKTACISTVEEYDLLSMMSESINTINCLSNKIFVNYKVSEESICEKSQRPIYLGVFIYDFAKRYMYENSYSKIGKKALLYTDTDASKFRHTDFVEWKRTIDTDNVQVPHWPEVEEIDPRYKNHKIYEEDSKVFGSFEDELAKMNKNKGVNDKFVFYCLQKKTWLYAVNDNVKYRFKGLNDNCLLLDSETLAEKPKVVEVSQSQATQNQKIHEYIMKNSANSLGKNQIKMFEEVHKNGGAFVLCKNMRRVVKNSLRNVDVEDTSRFNKEMNTVQVNYSIKYINIDKNKDEKEVERKKKEVERKKKLIMENIMA